MLGNNFFLIAVRSRSLLSVDPKLDFHVKACGWFNQIFMRENIDDFELNQSNNHPSSQSQIPLSVHITTNVVTAVNISRSEKAGSHVS